MITFQSLGQHDQFTAFGAEVPETGGALFDLVKQHGGRRSCWRYPRLDIGRPAQWPAARIPKAVGNGDCSSKAQIPALRLSGSQVENKQLFVMLNLFVLSK